MPSPTAVAIQKIKDAEAKAVDAARRKTATRLKQMADKIDFKGEEAVLLKQLDALYSLAAEIAAAVPGFTFRPKGTVVRKASAGRRSSGAPKRGVRKGSLADHILGVLGASKEPVEKEALWAAVKSHGYKSDSKDPTNTLGVSLSKLKSDGAIASFKKAQDGSFTMNTGKERGSFYGLPTGK